MFAGMTLFEHGIDRQPVWINDNAHWIVCAMTGSGKFTTSLALNAIFHPGSAVFISPKPEIVDFALGRRVDSTIFTNSNGRQPKPSLGVNPHDTF